MDVNAVDADIQFITELCLLLLYIFHTALETYLSTDLLLVNSARALILIEAITVVDLASRPCLDLAFTLPYPPLDLAITLP